MPRTLEYRARCPLCQTVRTLVGPLPASSPADLDAAESAIDAIGSVNAVCPRCGTVEQVALFVDGERTEHWCEAGEYEQRGGPDAGPLPRRPWPDTN